MKITTTAGLTKLIQLIKSSFISNTDVEETDEMDVVDATSLDIDSAPTSASTNLVTSGGVYTGLAGKVDVSQGVAQAGKYLTVGADGNVTLTSLPEYNGEVS